MGTYLLTYFGTKCVRRYVPMTHLSDKKCVSGYVPVTHS